MPNSPPHDAPSTEQRRDAVSGSSGAAARERSLPPAKDSRRRTPARASRRSARRWVVGFALGALALTALLVALGGGRWIGDAPVVDAELHGPVAILPVRLRGPIDRPWVPWGVAAILAETLEATPDVDALDAERLRDALARRALAGPQAELEAVRSVAFALGAQTVVEPSLRRDEDGVRLEATVHSRDGAPAVRLETRGGDALAAADDLLVSLGDAFVSSSRTPRFESLLSGDPFLDRLYARGLARWLGDRSAESPEADADRAAAALPYVSIVVREAPKFTSARRHLASLQLATAAGAGAPSEALATARSSALELLDAARGRRDVEAHAFELLARIDALAGADRSALENFAQAESRWQALGGRGEQARVLTAWARFASSSSASFASASATESSAGEALASGDSEPVPGESVVRDAEALERQALDLQRAEGDALGAVASLRRLAGHRLRAEDSAAADELLAEALEAARAVGDGELVGRVSGDLAGIAWRRGDARATIGHLDVALAPAETAASTGDPVAALHLLRIHDRRASAFEALGDLAAAEDAGRDALDLAEDLGAVRFEADAWVRLARLQLILGYPRQARDALDQALQRDRHVRDRRGLQRVIAWTAYEEGRFALAARTLGILRDADAPGEWTLDDSERLVIYQQAAAAGRRLPLPGDRGD